MRTAPWEIADAVEMYARKLGTHAKIVWVPSMPAWVIRFEEKADSPKMKAWKDAGSPGDPPTEDVYLIEFDERTNSYQPKDLDDLGVSGVVELLERGDVLSGRGEYASLNEAVMAQIERTRRNMAETRKKVREFGENIGRERRRQFEGVPLVNVPRTITADAPTPAQRKAE